MGETPDRIAELSLALASIRSGKGVFVAGERGSGRTHLIRSAIDELDDDLRQRLWLGDDLHRLDEAESARLARAISANQILPLSAVDSRMPLARSLERLWRDGVVERVELRPHTSHGVLAVVESLLGGPLDPASTLSFVPRRDGGDLVVLNDALREAVAAGVLVEVDGIWRLTAPLPPRDGLRRKILARLGRAETLSSTSTLILDCLGSVPGIGMDRALTLVGALIENAPESPGEDRLPDHRSIARRLEHLESDGLIDVIDAGGALSLRIHDAMVELVLPQTIGLLRRQRIAAAAVDAFSAVPLTELHGTEIVAFVQQSFALGRVVDPTVLTWMAREALSQSRSDLALQFALVAVENGGGYEAQVAMAVAEAQSGRAVEALERLRRQRPVLQKLSGRIDALDDLMAVMGLRIADPSFRWGSQSMRVISTNPRTLAHGLRLDPTIGVHLKRGTAVDADDEMVVLIEGERLGQAASAAMLRGDQPAALRYIDIGEAGLDRIGGDTRLLRMRRAIAGGFDGNLSEAIVSVRNLREDAAAAGQSGQCTIATTVLGDLLMFAGRVPEAVEEYGSSLRMMEGAGTDQATANVRANLAIAHVYLGRSVDLSAVLGAVSSDDAYIRGVVLRASGWINVEAGDLDAAIADLTAAADAFESLGYRTPTLMSLHEAARAGAALLVLDRAQEHARASNATMNSLLAHHVDLLAQLQSGEQADTDETRTLAACFDQIADTFSDGGFSIWAAEGYSSAWSLYSRAGEDRLAARSARRSGEQLAVCGLLSAPFVLSQPDTATLSVREVQIASRAAAGRSNREIAAELVLSVRTVETHLLRVYKKLGIRTRSALPSDLDD
jgi:DNA-binding CsgD family transcriptional regulator